MYRGGLFLEVKYYSIKDAALILKVNPATVRRKIKSGVLQGELIEGAYGKQYMIPAEQIEPYTNPVAYTDVVQTTRQVPIVEIENILTKAVQKAVDPLHEEIRLLRAEIEQQKLNYLELAKASPQEEKSWWKRLLSKL